MRIDNKKSIWVFTPSRTDPKDLEFILVQRHQLLQDAVERVRESALTKHKHHLLFIGPRGCGKTHLVTLIVSRLLADPELADRMYKSIDLAVQGEIDEKRLIPSYTNPALMFGALLDFAANHDNRADWKQLSAVWNEKVFALFDKHGAFAEYNSPTYYGVDLYALVLWRAHPALSPLLAQLGREMEMSLWRRAGARALPTCSTKRCTPASPKVFISA